jgi:hypothetical protein
MYLKEALSVISHQYSNPHVRVYRLSISLQRVLDFNAGSKIANEEDDSKRPSGIGKDPRGMVKGKHVDKGNLSTEEEVEWQRSVLMQWLPSLRAECKTLEQKVEQATQENESLEVQEETKQDV